jgi:alpha,alpha-trehalase
VAQDYLPVLDSGRHELEHLLRIVPGCWVERKKYSIAVHYRNTPSDHVAQVRAAVEVIAGRYHDLRICSGKAVFELRPAIDWDKGKAVMWLLDALKFDLSSTLPVYVGDDATDEDAFASLQELGICVVVGEDRETRAHYKLRDIGEVQRFLLMLARLAAGKGPDRGTCS